MVMLNLDQVPDGGGGVLEPGVYLGTIKEVEQRTSSSGNEMFSVRWEVEGRKVFDSLVFTEKALWKVRQYLKALGIQFEGDFELQPNDLMHKQATLVLIQEPYVNRDGQERMGNKIKEIKPADETTGVVEDEIPF